MPRVMTKKNLLVHPSYTPQSPLLEQWYMLSEVNELVGYRPFTAENLRRGPHPRVKATKQPAHNRHGFVWGVTAKEIARLRKKKQADDEKKSRRQVLAQVAPDFVQEAGQPLPTELIPHLPVSTGLGRLEDIGKEQHRLSNVVADQHDTLLTRLRAIDHQLQSLEFRLSAIPAGDSIQWQFVEEILRHTITVLKAKHGDTLDASATAPTPERNDH